MIKSMTGYGFVQGRLGRRRVVAETKSVNHKFCEVNLRLAPSYLVFEGKIAELAKSFFSRGRIDILLKEESPAGRESASRIDFKKLREYYETLRKAAQKLKIPGELDINTLVTLPQVLVPEEEEDLDSLWEQVAAMLRKSFTALEKMRQREGAAIGRFFKDELKILAEAVDTVEVMVPKNVEYHRAQLQERIAKLAPGIELDPARLAQEIAYFADRTDISEELQRLKHHIGHFHELLQVSGPLGRKLDFLLQEMNREANTLSAKVQDSKISQRMVACKHSLEKLREQVQNVE
ncbi:MAG TPA: YicC family protein [Deltaproteobacteria bacterium]|nr:YicC family protein [Deltaproteobacteria bacterium]